MGSASAKPIIERNQSAHVLEVHERLFLIDCGEGTQRQMFRFKKSIAKIDSIFISHSHGDHLFGLFPLLSTLGLESRIAPVCIYGPANLEPFIKFFMSYYGKGIGVEIRFTPLKCKEPEIIYETKSFQVLAFPLNHRVETFGYIFREKMPLMNVRKEALEKYEFTKREIGALKQGEDVIRPAGPDEGATFFNGFIRHSGTDEPLVIKNEEAAYLPYEPRSYAYCSDTAPFPELVDWVRGVNVLYHETTYLAELEEKAISRYHSTTLHAARTAKEAGVGKLLIGHYSSRCRNIAQYADECKTIFPETYAVNDGDVIEIM